MLLYRLFKIFFFNHHVIGSAIIEIKKAVDLESLLPVLFRFLELRFDLSLKVTKARSKRRSIQAPNLTDELSTAEERRLNQFGLAD